jgi:phosphatidylserine/phosphatidylglycerophosphate/cardiolipin synthase-like enzyme
VRNNKVRVAEGWIQRYIRKFLLNIDDQHTSEAEHWIQKAIESDQKNGTIFNLGKAYVLYADLVTGSFNFTKAAEENNAENLLIIRGGELASFYIKNWQEHAQHSEVYTGEGQ